MRSARSRTSLGGGSGVEVPASQLAGVIFWAYKFYHAGHTLAWVPVYSVCLVGYCCFGAYKFDQRLHGRRSRYALYDIVAPLYRPVVRVPAPTVFGHSERPCSQKH
jgi:hypothetical protein